MDTTILCLASYEKGAEFLRECAALGCPAILVTVGALRDATWPRDRLAGFFWTPDFADREAVVNGVSWLARTRRLERIVPLDEFDLELAASLREHLRLQGMGESASRYFRDKLAMRQKASAVGMRVPGFSAVFNDEVVRSFTGRTMPPWVLKPRTQAAAVGIRRIDSPGEIWPALETLGDRRSHYLIEEYVSGPVYHVDSVVADGNMAFAAASRYATPPFDVAHGGGLFSSTTVLRGSVEEHSLLDSNREVLFGLGAETGVYHTEFIRSDADGTLVFLETAARVGGAHIVEMVEAATGVNLWREWARVEVAAARGTPYEAPAARADYAGILLSLARQERPDMSGYTDPEIVWRIDRKHHAGLIVASPDPARVAALMADYMPRFRADFFASMPAPDRPTA